MHISIYSYRSMIGLCEEYLPKNSKGFRYKALRILEYSEHDDVDFVSYLVEIVNKDGRYTGSGVKFLNDMEDNYEKFCWD